MIDRKPTPGNLDWFLMEPYEGGAIERPLLYDTPARRKSNVLGIDGQPMLIDVPRRKIGFDLSSTHRKETK